LLDVHLWSVYVEVLGGGIPFVGAHSKPKLRL
jgi:hypothetical protein